MGDELALVVDSAIKNTFVKTNSANFGTSAQWLDEIDLREAMKNKPEQQIQNVMKNSRTMLHATEKVVLYECLTHTGNSVETTVATHERQLTMNNQQTLKGQKRARIEGEPKEKAVPAPKLPKPEKQIPLVGKGLAKIEALFQTVLLLADREEPANLLKAFPDIPRIYCESLSIRKAELLIAQAELNLAISTGTGRAAQLASATKKVMDEYKTICEKILSQSEDLQQMGIKPLTE